MCAVSQIDGVIPPGERVLGSVSLDFFPNTGVNILNLGKSNGSALLHVVTNLSASVSNRTHPRTKLGVNCLPRRPMLSRSGAIHRVIRRTISSMTKTLAQLSTICTTCTRRSTSFSTLTGRRNSLRTVVRTGSNRGLRGALRHTTSTLHLPR